MQKKNYSLQELASLTECKLLGNPQHIISNVADLDNATDQDASFFANIRYRQSMIKSKAGVIFIEEPLILEDGRNYLISKQPSRSFQQLVDLLHPLRKTPSGFIGIHPSATIHPTAQIGDSVTIGPQAVVDEGVKIGSRTFIGAGVYVGPDTIIGCDCTIYPHVVLREECVVGDRVVIQPGAVIGSCGFGFTTDREGNHIKLNQVGNVNIENDVEIGANTTIDRSRFKSTVIGRGTKIDNLVQIGHGVEVGPYNLIIAQTAIAGSSSTGKHVVLAGQVAVAGHLHLDDGVMVAGKSGVTKSLKTGKYGGTPAVPITEYNRNEVFLKRIETYVNQIKSLETRIQKLELK
ncbi:MAG: UDP-3-O-(3-hydroxymyristoyl)glucosamine N-acyltransferase [Parachlamydiaceae bacterium]|nr:UDP-3-O-(3-hydroxymyristoyl)glucosamine N-acyltransferase [Parachlamydiaceae bacterium]